MDITENNFNLKIRELEFKHDLLKKYLEAAYKKMESFGIGESKEYRRIKIAPS